MKNISNSILSRLIDHITLLINRVLGFLHKKKKGVLCEEKNN